MVDINQTCSSAFPEVPGNLYLTLINALMLSKCSLDNTENLYQENYAPLLKDGDIFDFIIIGGGSAGSVVANRLSENSNWTVLLLEAGGYPSLNSEVPGLYLNSQLTETDWQYETEPNNKQCLGFKNKRCRWPRGKLLGGSSAINGMLYVRGDCGLYDDWEELGNPGWNCLNATNYFKKSENVQKEEFKSSPIHGTKGYLATSEYKEDIIMKEILWTAAEQIGVPFGDDEIHVGMYEALMTTENGRRCSSAKAFLSKVKHRKNLLVATKVLATRLLIGENNTHKEISGVLVEINNTTIVLKARKEVIVSGGTINSPQLLQLSGIGPKDSIQKPIVDLPVGKNLQDHFGNFGIIIKLDSVENKTQLESLKDVYDYYSEFNGPLSGLGTLNTVYFLETKNRSMSKIQIHFVHIQQNTGPLLSHYLEIVGFNNVSAESIIKANQNYDLIFLVPTLLNPKSRGIIKIRSTNPHDKPIINSGYLDELVDFKGLLNSVDSIKTLINTEVFQKYNAEFLKYDIPRCKNLIFDSIKYWKCVMRNFGSTVYHPAGTCKMGPANDPTTVVDSRLKVLGINNLRVIDLSITPTVPHGNTNAPAIMIGEKGADLIKEDWGFIEKDNNI